MITGLSIWIKLALIATVIAAITGGSVGIHHHIFQQGVTQEKDRRDKIDAANTIKAQTILVAENEKVRALQAQIAAVQIDLSTKQMELQNARNKSAALESDLRAGTKRMSVLIARNKADPAGCATSSGASNLDQGTEVTAELDGTVAANLVGIAAEGDSAITRMNACIVAYDAVKAASDALQPKP